MNFFPDGKFCSTENLLMVYIWLYLANFMMQVNPNVIVSLEEHGLKFVGKDESGKRMEVGFTASRTCLVLFNM